MQLLAKAQSKSATREKILAAAARVFAEEGLAGSTTRAIAKSAGVNEVTLFRHFGTKDRLIAAVIGQNFADKEEASSSHSSDLEADLFDFAIRYEGRLTENLPLIRTMLAEIHRHREQESNVLHSIFRPMRAGLVERLERADLRPGLTPEMAADLFAGMIFAGVLRRSKPTAVFEYSSDQYRRAAVAILMGGMSVSELR
jgi:AcrR family transcriptional regulator